MCRLGENDLHSFSLNYLHKLSSSPCALVFKVQMNSEKQSIGELAMPSGENKSVQQIMQSCLFIVRK